VDDVRGKIKQLRDLGFRIAVDDLGAGYAGLTSFAQLEPDIVKLDMSLVRDIHLKPTRRALVLGLLSACRSLGVDVVAEGIENAEECEVLVESGVELLQGYFFGRPNRDLVAPAFG
jgi:EAL domain-containing protein (putative c-di-GMP-specific phosphodiesterase class I)